MTDYSGFMTFRVDPLLSQELRKSLDHILSTYKEAKVEEFGSLLPRTDEDRLTVDFISENSLHLIKPNKSLKICLLDKNQGLFSFGQNIDHSDIDAVLDDGLDRIQIEKLISPSMEQIIKRQEDKLFHLSEKNLKKFEAKGKRETQKSFEGGSVFTSEDLLNYTQSLVDLEKDLIHAENLFRIEKVLRQFAKNHLDKAKFQCYSSLNIWKIEASDKLLPLPKFKGEFLILEMNWDDANYFFLIKKLFFYYTIINFFSSQQEIADPFFDGNLWESVLDGIPFPVALLSQTGEVYQHNTLFSKLNLAPVDCLKFKLREKILVHDIPYNVFRKDVHHLDETKILFVFFTESFFLKGDGNLTPSGQELGIISSSIAHELNNPIAGIQAALTLLLLDDELNEEERQTLDEMKNGSMRCKQLIETFLGFSRANPTSLTTIELRLSPVEVCYQQAQNLLRFRTVESGIRFSLQFTKHSDFRASVNLSLMTMTFYLILGELMTLYSHQLLVADKNQIEKVIKGELIESSQEIQIQLHELNISTLSLSKLIQNLLTIENFVLQISDYSLRFIYSPPRDA